MDIRVLNYFLTVAREGSITAAANVLHITQPTLSRQLKELEQELGHKLFTRSNYCVNLTNEGLLLRRRAEDIVSMVTKTTQEFANLNNLIAGDIHIGAAESDSIRCIARLIRTIHTQYPAIKFHFHSGNAELITERLDKGLLDFGIIAQQLNQPKYNFLTLPQQDTWGVLMKKTSPLAAKKVILAEDIAGLPLICSIQAVDEELAKWFGDYFDRLNIAATYNLLFNASLLVQEGVGYALCFDKIIPADNADSPLCFRPLYPPLTSELNIIWKKYQLFSPPAKVFLENIQKALPHTDT